jgi:anti-sigma B factor antagonist
VADKGMPSLAPVIIAMPGEIDVTNAGDVQARISAALGPGVTVIVADLTATSFCDSTGLRHLLQAHDQAATLGAQLRLAITPGGPIWRVAELTGLGRWLAIYPTLRDATDGHPPPAS